MEIDFKNYIGDGESKKIWNREHYSRFETVLLA